MQESGQGRGTPRPRVAATSPEHPDNIVGAARHSHAAWERGGRNGRVGWLICRVVGDAIILHRRCPLGLRIGFQIQIQIPASLPLSFPPSSPQKAGFLWTD